MAFLCLTNTSLGVGIVKISACWSAGSTHDMGQITNNPFFTKNDEVVKN
jgi:hypothetical protein